MLRLLGLLSIIFWFEANRVWMWVEYEEQRVGYTDDVASVGGDVRVAYTRFVSRWHCYCRETYAGVVNAPKSTARQWATWRKR